MRNLILALALLFMSALNVKAQDEFEPFLTNEFGLNVNALASNIFSFDAGNSLTGNQNLLYFKTGKGNRKFRSSLNFNVETSAQSNSNLVNSFYLLKLGVETKQRLSKSWVYHSGVELFGSTNISKVTTNDVFFGEFNSTNSTSRFGVSWLYGIQLLINERIGIGTEGYVFLSLLEDKTVSDIQGNPPNTSRSTGFNLGMDLPASLLFSFYF